MLVGTVEEQVKREEEARGKRLDKYLRELNEAIIKGRLNETPEGKMLIKLGYLPYKEKLKEYFNSSTRGQLEKDKKFILLMCDNTDVIAFVVLSALVSLAGVGTVTVASAAKKIAIDLKKIYFFDMLKKDNPRLHSYLGYEYKRASKRRKDELIAKHIKELYNIDFDGNENALGVRVGTILIDLLVKSGAGIITLQRERLNTIKRAYTVKLTEVAQNILVNSSDIQKIMSTSIMMPMVVPPRDWEAPNKGGYLTHKVQFIKASNSRHKQYIKKQDLSLIYPKINKLQQTSWRINRRVLDVMYDIYTNNLIDPLSSKVLPRCFGGIPSSNNYNAEDLIEPCPVKEDYMESKNGEKIFYEEWHKWNRKRESVKIDLDAEVSRRLGFTYALNVAQKMIDYKEFWYVYQLDYRGRVYPHNEFLNPQSKSYVKAMLEFGSGAKLTSRGVYWLKVHIANVYGLDKKPFKDRIEFVDNNVDLLLRVANNPLGNLSDWVYTDSPYEFLAGCYAYKDYLDDKEVYLPIQLDATCSGIQFYSGLLLDREGALSVNVIGNTRQDIYQKVADKVTQKLEEGDYPKVVEFKDSEGKERSKFTFKEAESLKGNISRSVCKRNVMTVPYSVTLRGMSDQNHDYMHKCELEGKVFWKGDKWVVNKLITDLNYRSIYEVVRGAKLGQEYLKEVAANATEVATWYTPLYRFPVLQPAYKRKSINIRTPIGRLELIQRLDGVDKAKQASSIAANFIHSLDSTLLLYCVDNISSDIGVIHDCFLVHPNLGDEIRHHYKEGYIKIMKSEPLRLFGEHLDPEGKVEVPLIGTLDLDEVRDSEYILS